MINLKVSVVLVLTFMFFHTTEGMSADIRKGTAAYKRGDYTTAVREWEPFARKGNAQLQNIMGTMYLKGLGVPQNNKEAAKWYKLAAKQGHTAAQSGLKKLNKFLNKSRRGESSVVEVRKRKRTRNVRCKRQGKNC